MGCWGMGMTQSDQFMETYETFMDEYNEGAAVPNITKRFWSNTSRSFHRTIRFYTMSGSVWPKQNGYAASSRRKS